jgi:lycopene beta-cyclase
MNTLLQKLSRYNHVEFVKGKVSRIEGNSVYTDIAEPAFKAKQYVFDSIPPVNLPHGLIWQHFLGWEIVSETDIFDVKSFRLMDFRVSQQEGPAFMYLLPFSPRSALIEFTLMSPEVLPDNVYEAHLATYMAQFFGGVRYQITDKEKGQIPMTMEMNGLSTSHYYSIGTRGGFTKPTTGYTFMNVWRHAQLTAHELAAGRVAIAHQAKASRYQFYDRLLLNIMKRSPHEVAPIMEKLFLSNSFSSILSFISERSSPLQEMQIFGSLPWMPFFRAIAYEYFLKQDRTSS